MKRKIKQTKEIEIFHGKRTSTSLRKIRTKGSQWTVVSLTILTISVSTSLLSTKYTQPREVRLSSHQVPFACSFCRENTVRSGHIGLLSPSQKRIYKDHRETIAKYADVDQNQHVFRTSNNQHVLHSFTLPLPPPDSSPLSPHSCFSFLPFASSYRSFYHSIFKRNAKRSDATWRARGIWFYVINV